MALHQVEHGRGDDSGDVYSHPLSQEPLPKYRVPKRTSPPETVHALVRDELALDGNSSQNLATFCTTWAEPQVHALMDECLDKNMIDKDEYPQTAEIESRCVHMLADLWHSPRDAAPPAARPRAPAKRQCSAASRSNGAGANAAAPRAKRQTARIWWSVRSRSVGKNSHAISMWSCASPVGAERHRPASPPTPRAHR